MNEESIKFPQFSSDFDPERFLPEPKKSFFKKHKLGLSIFLVVVVILFCTVLFLSTSPSNFPDRKIVTIPNGTSLTTAGSILKEQNIIRYAFMYRLYVHIFNDGNGVQAGSYLFDKPQTAMRVAYRMVNNIQGLDKIKVTIPEGSSSKDITSILSKNIPGFASTTFNLLARDREGYLFPDTYFFFENTKPEQVISAMNLNFNNQISTIKSSIDKFGKPLSSVIAMASIVEKEATSSPDRRIISGILWKRIANKYPLQVDPPFFYFLSKKSEELTLRDLAVDSPYNLYKYRGLPPTPIDNPGLSTILDTVSPTETKYWFYLSDRQGKMHYAVTYEEHLVNKAKYVDK